MPEDPVIRWENEGGAILLANGAERDAPRESEGEESDLAQVKDRSAESLTRVAIKRGGSTTSAD